MQGNVVLPKNKYGEVDRDNNGFLKKHQGRNRVFTLVVRPNGQLTLEASGDEGEGEGAGIDGEPLELSPEERAE